MPSVSKKSHGPEVQARVRNVLAALLTAVEDQPDLKRGQVLKAAWAEDGQRLTVETTLRTLVQLVQPELGTHTPEFKRTKAQTGEALLDLRDFVGLLEDHRTQKQGSDKWHFSLRLWGRDIQRNLAEFDQVWESQRSPTTAVKPAPTPAPKSPLKPGAPLPRVRLPDNFVARSEALAAVKAKLLADSGQTLVVSAISGLGGLGKSVLATAIVLDPEVQARFSDGILWVTLGQNPDLASQLGDWLRTLDKSRDTYSVTTLELARDYLHNLLTDRRMLLVVDDVWHAAHAEWFRVGGSGCRVLVTTREAQLDGAEYHRLDVMTADEAISLVRQKLGDCWRDEDEPEFRGFAKALGYLPLALDLAANQVQDGLTWAELRQEFEVERRAVALELLDSTEAWEYLPEEDQRKYSLRACFHLSLKRLNPEQLRQFAGLGVLPEDVTLTAPVAAVLWDVPPLRAKRGLIDLRRRSFLTEGRTTLTGEPTYRVHDLMHDTARGLIEAGQLPGIGDLAAAHGTFVDRYGSLDFGAKCCGLPKDGYIHRHLIWHLVQAGREAAVHELLAASDGAGRNTWFEACEEVGEPGIFVTAIAEAWELAEKWYEQEPGRAIRLQCRYALITATLNSLADQLPAGILKAFVQSGFWAVERAWAYVEQMQDERKIAEAIQALAADLTQPLFQMAAKKARSMQSEFSRAKVLNTLAQLDGAYFAEALATARLIQDESRRARVLNTLAQIDAAYFAEALEAARSIQSESRRARALSTLAQIDAADFAQLLAAARSIQDESSRAGVLSTLAQIDRAYFAEALEAARLIQSELSRARVLSTLAQIDGADLAQLLGVTRSIQSEYHRAEVLSTLAQLDGAYFAEALEVARSIQDEYSRAWALSILAQIDAAYWTETLEVARLIQDEYSRAEVLSALAQIDAADFAQLLEAARLMQDEDSRAEVLSTLAQIDAAYLAEALAAAQSMQDKVSRAEVLSTLAEIDRTYFAEALEAARLIQDGYHRAEVLSTLAQIDGADFAQLLAAARSIQDESSRAEVLSTLAQIDGAYFAEAVEAARSIQDESRRAEVLSSLVLCQPLILGLPLLRMTTGHSLWRSSTLISKCDVALAQIDGADFAQLLEAARSIQDESSRAEVLSTLAQIDGADFAQLLEAARSMQSEYRRARVLSSLAQIDGADFAQLLEAARSIQDESSRADVLSALAQSAPEACLPQIYSAIFDITHLPTRAVALSGYLSRLPLATLPYADWQTHLHLLAYRKRADLMPDLATLYPAIEHLGGVGAMRGVVDEIHRVCTQWP